MPIPQTFFETCPLNPHESEVIVALINEITQRHPGITGFALKGSVWNKTRQLPDADIDIQWCGQPDESLQDPLMGFRKVFTREGVLIDLSTWFWSDLGRPETSGLSTAVSLAHSRILWERDGAFTTPRRAVQKLLHERAWVMEKLAAEFAGYRQSLALWTDPTKRNPYGHAWDFARHVCNSWGISVLSSLTLRPPSTGRKALREIVDCSHLLQVPWFGEIVLQVMGASDITPDEAQQWTDQFAQLMQQTQTLKDTGRLPPETDLGTLRYNLSAMRAMIASGWHRESVWPCWRAYHTLVALLSETPLGPNVCEHTWQFRKRLGFFDDASITTRLSVITAAVDRLECASEQMLDLYFDLLPKASAGWKAV